MKKTLQVFISITILIGLSSFWTSTNAQITSDSGLVAYYPFSENANDESGNGYNGTVHGAQLTGDYLDNMNNAYLFNGIDDVISTPHGIQDVLNIPDNITIAAWVRLDYVNNSLQAAVSNAHNGGIELGYMGSLNKRFFVSFYINNLYFKGFSLNAPVESEWVHLVGTYSHETGQGGEIRFYVNGSLEDINPGMGDYSIKGSTEVLAIGANPNPYNPFFEKYWKGAIDEVRIYNRALDESEIEYLYLSVDNDLINHGVGIYPNPTTGYITIESDNEFNSSDFEIFDIFGKRILRAKINSTEEKINLSELQKGIYVIQIKSNDDILTKRIIKH